MRFVIIALLGLSMSYQCASQSISPDFNSFGFIIIDDSVYNGTGFVMGDARTVITCAHVYVSGRKISYKSTLDGQVHDLKIVHYDKYNDIAVLRSKEDLCVKPFQADNVSALSKGQHFFYIGYNKRYGVGKKLQVDNGHINGTGKIKVGEIVVDYIEFIGIAIGGYSGGPVINDNGKVIGLIRDMRVLMDSKKDSVIINRAFSIKPVLKFLPIASPDKN